MFRLGCGHRKSTDSTSQTAKTVRPTHQDLDDQKNTFYWIELAEKACERIMKRMLEKHESSNSISFLNLAIKFLFNCRELIEAQERRIKTLMDGIEKSFKNATYLVCHKCHEKQAITTKSSNQKYH